MNGVVPLDVESIDRAAMLTAIARADVARDMAPVWQLLERLLTTSGLPRDQILATVLFKLSMDAAAAGDRRDEAALLQAMRENCSRRAIDGAVLSGLLMAGRQGRLNEGAYQQLATRIEQLPEGHPARALFATIGRVGHHRAGNAKPGHRTGS